MIVTRLLLVFITGFILTAAQAEPNLLERRLLMTLEMNDNNAKRLFPKQQYAYLRKYYPKYRVASFCMGYFHSKKYIDIAVALVHPKTHRSIFLVLVQKQKGFRGVSLTTAKVDLSQGTETRCMSYQKTRQLDELIRRRGDRIHGGIRPIHKFNNICIGAFNHKLRGPLRRRRYDSTYYTCYAYRHRTGKFKLIGSWVYR
ncbi:MAG: hypothetical protein BMS9Abin11_0178 [Gammaproteobacteria bacterium]|nr:MAG: hypothetical protein BMS9Abin11_0178 [Gammaproteobacteria bacterium]